MLLCNAYNVFFRQSAVAKTEVRMGGGVHLVCSEPRLKRRGNSRFSFKQIKQLVVNGISTGAPSDIFVRRFSAGDICVPGPAYADADVRSRLVPDIDVLNSRFYF